MYDGCDKCKSKPKVLDVGSPMILQFIGGAASFGRSISKPLPRRLTLGSATTHC
jgi:hypothetical protein